MDFGSRKTYNGLIEGLDSNQILVFGSNPQGWHGKGLALIAKNKFGAKQGKGRGLHGKSYALVTKNMKVGWKEPSTNIVYRFEGPRSLKEDQIIANIEELYETAKINHRLEFLVGYTANSKNLNGYTAKEMARMFFKAGRCGGIPKNVIFEDEFSLFVYR